MSDKWKPQRRLIWAVILIVIPAIYVLSIGPAFRIKRAGYISFKAFISVYWPVTNLALKSKTSTALLVRYLGWWSK